jgi:hypothetical protein
MKYRIHEQYDLLDTPILKYFRKEKLGAMYCVWGIAYPTLTSESNFVASLYQDGFLNFLLQEDETNLTRELRSDYELAWTIFRDTKFHIVRVDKLDKECHYKISNNEKDSEVDLLISYDGIDGGGQLCLAARYGSNKEFEFLSEVLAAAKSFLQSKNEVLLGYYESGAHLKYADSGKILETTAEKIVPRS